MRCVTKLAPHLRSLFLQRNHPLHTCRNICRSTQLIPGEVSLPFSSVLNLSQELTFSVVSVRRYPLVSSMRKDIAAAEVGECSSVPQFVPVRYASKNMKKEKKGAKIVELTPEEAESVINFPEYERAMENVVEEFRDTLQKQFSLRISSGK